MYEFGTGCHIHRIEYAILAFREGSSTNSQAFVVVFFQLGTLNIKEDI